MILIQKIIQTYEFVAVSDLSNNLVYGTFGAIVVGALVVGAVTTVVGTGINMYRSTKDRKNAARKAGGLQGEIDFIEENRQEIINPFEGVSDLSDMAVDLSGMAQNLSGMITDTSGVISNPMANLAVSTAAAEFQAEEADIALANTLDMLAATGSSAGGATALAQAALQSKRGVAITIEQQEKSNQDKAARGEERVQNAKQSEAQRLQAAQFGEASRIQNIQMSEAQRLQQFGIGQAEKMQDVGVKSELFQFNQEEKRTYEQLDRLSSQLSGQRRKEAQASANYSNAISSGVQGLTSMAGSVATAGIMKGG